MKKIFFVNRFFYPDHSATSQLLTDLAFGLVEKGVCVEIVSSSKLYQRKTCLGASTEQVNGVRVHRLWSLPIGGGGLFARILDYSLFYVLAFIKLLTAVRPGDTVVGLTDPPMLDVIVKLAGSVRGARVAHWLQDIFPEVAGELGFRAAKGPAGRMLRYLRNTSLQHSDLIVVIGDGMRLRLIENGIDHPRISVIHNWADEGSGPADGEKVVALRRSWGLGGKFVVGYSGNLGRAHTYESIFEAARRLVSEQDIVFLWTGGGVRYEELRQKVLEEGLSNFLFKPYQKREELSIALRVPDCHLITLNKRLEGLIVPSKFYGIAAVGRPAIFVGREDGEIATVIRQNDCGAVVEESDVEGLVDTICRLKNDPVTTVQMGNHARALYEDQFAKGRAVSRWYKLLTELD